MISEKDLKNELNKGSQSNSQSHPNKTKKAQKQVSNIMSFFTSKKSANKIKDQSDKLDQKPSNDNQPIPQVSNQEQNKENIELPPIKVFLILPENEIKSNNFDNHANLQTTQIKNSTNYEKKYCSIHSVEETTMTPLNFEDKKNKFDDQKNKIECLNEEEQILCKRAEPSKSIEEDEEIKSESEEIIPNRTLGNPINEQLDIVDIAPKLDMIPLNKACQSKLNISSDSESDEEESQKIKEGHPSLYDKILLMKLPKDVSELSALKNQIIKKIEFQKKYFFYENMIKLKNEKSSVPENSVPICADVTSYNFMNLAKTMKKITNKEFDIIMMDPPWQLSTSTPSRGVAIAYSSLTDELIKKIPVLSLQTSGFLLIWVINAKYSLACDMFDQWGYNLVDEIVWIKKTVTGKIAKGHGFYLQHAKETCLVGFKGDYFHFLAERYCRQNNIDLSQIEQIKISKKEEILKLKKTIANDVIFSERRGQSQKPNEIYSIVEQLCPNGHYLEIFGRRNNLHKNWVTLGNEL